MTNQLDYAITPEVQRGMIICGKFVKSCLAVDAPSTLREDSSSGSGVISSTDSDVTGDTAAPNDTGAPTDAAGPTNAASPSKPRR